MATKKTEVSKATKQHKATTKPNAKAMPEETPKKPWIKASDLLKMEAVAKAKEKLVWFILPCVSLGLWPVLLDT